LRCALLCYIFKLEYSKSLSHHYNVIMFNGTENYKTTNLYIKLERLTCVLTTLALADSAKAS
jgi:hypothetical protein